METELGLPAVTAPCYNKGSEKASLPPLGPSSVNVIWVFVWVGGQGHDGRQVTGVQCSPRMHRQHVSDHLWRAQNAAKAEKIQRSEAKHLKKEKE